MKYSEAYSIDLGRSVTPKQADNYRAEGLISSPDAFLCASKNCSAVMKCINLDKPSKKRKRDPYFASKDGTGSHQNCDYHEESALHDVIHETHKKRFTNRTKTDLTEVIFLAKAPKRLPRKSSDPRNPIITFTRSASSSGGGTGKPISPNNSQVSRVLSLVQKFNEMNGDQHKHRFVHIGPSKMSFDDLFIEIEYGRELEEGVKRIYYGLAYIDQTNPKTWKLTFHFKQSINDKTSKPSLFISQEAIESYSEKNRFTKLIEKGMAAEGRKIHLFVYGSPTFSSNKKHINLAFDSLDHVHFEATARPGDSR